MELESQFYFGMEKYHIDAFTADYRYLLTKIPQLRTRACQSLPITHILSKNRHKEEEQFNKLSHFRPMFKKVSVSVINLSFRMNHNN